MDVNFKEDLDMVFDKGVESIHTVYYYYLVELTRVLDSLLEDFEKARISLEINGKVKAFFNEKYAFLIDRLRKELDVSYSCLSIDKMNYNDIRYTKIVTHVMFIQKLKNHSNELNRMECKNILDKFRINSLRLNCFSRLFLGNK